MVRRAVLSVVIAIVVASFASAQTQVVRGVAWEKDLAKGRTTMAQKKRPMMLFLSAPGCVYCELMKQNVFTQPWVKKEVDAKYVPVILNGREHKEITKRLEVRSFPVIAIVHPDGKVIEVVRGYKDPTSFVKVMAVAKAKLKVHEQLIASKANPSTR